MQLRLPACLVCLLAAVPAFGQTAAPPDPELEHINQELIVLNAAYGNMLRALTEFGRSRQVLREQLAKAESDLRWLRESYVPKDVGGLK